MSEEVTKTSAEATSKSDAIFQETPANPAKQGDLGLAAKKEEASSTGGKETQPQVKEEAKQKTEQETVVQKEYELKMPEDSKLDPSRLAEIVSFAKENKLSNEAAQAILDREHSAVAGFAEAQQKQLTQSQEQWVKAAQEDKEIGGEAFKENVERAKDVLKRFGSPELLDALDKTGLGNHPELVRTFVRISKQMAPDKMVIPGSGQKAASQKSIGEIFYGTNS